MEHLRFRKIAEELANLGFAVDFIVNHNDEVIPLDNNMRFVSYKSAQWEAYDIIKTTTHKGFEFLSKIGADDHPFIISKLGSVVGSHDEIPGVYFFKKNRQQLYETQKKISQKSRYVTLLTQQSKELWRKEHRGDNSILLVPTGTDLKIPLPNKNPYSKFSEKIAVYIGNIYSKDVQKEVNLIWQNRLNTLGRKLKKRGIRLCLVGKGAADEIDHHVVTHLGAVRYEDVFDYHYFADVGIVLAQGEIQHNESSKIYYYLRTGLPMVSEKPVPNNNLIREANLGFVVPYNDHHAMVERIEEAVYEKWDRAGAVDYILKNHTWTQRVQKYYRIIREELLTT
jgi:glycosyltransferase involved in cell wall biosynthesis